MIYTASIAVYHHAIMTHGAQSVPYLVVCRDLSQRSIQLRLKYSYSKVMEN